MRVLVLVLVLVLVRVLVRVRVRVLQDGAGSPTDCWPFGPPGPCGGQRADAPGGFSRCHALQFLRAADGSALQPGPADR